MVFDILNFLVATVNQKLRSAKAALETEEKNREIATLQGNIIGWRKLLDYIVEIYKLTDAFIADSGEEATLIESMDTLSIDRLHMEKERLIISNEWKDLLVKVAVNRESLKESLITFADSARDLYLAQAQQKGLTAYGPLFTALTVEYNRRNEELNFEGANTQGDLPVE
jgi:hypothetical protein